VNLATIAWKSIRQRGLASSLTALSVALGVMLMVAVLVIYGILQSTFSQRSINYDLIIGAKGDPLQLVLSTVYHISPPIENLPYRYYLDMQKDPRVQVAIPVCMGDTTEQGGFPIVGTIPEFFEMEYAPKKPFLIKGQGFQGDFDAYIGDRVAKENGWGLGTKLKLVHGGAETHVHNEEFEVVGLLAPTGTPHDKSVYVNLKGFYRIQGHDKPLKEAIERERKFYGEPALSKDDLDAEMIRVRKKAMQSGIPDLQKEVTAILLQCKSPIAANLLSGELKKGNQSQGVNPIVPMQKLLKEFLGPAEQLLLVMTSLIVLVSGISIFVSIYNSMSARRREIAIMRALGAQRSTVLTIILAESIILCVGGGILGLLLGHGLVFGATPLVAAKTGLIINPLAFSPYELVIFPILFALGALVGFLPGMTAYRTDVAESLGG
jgi:putative ABC transport system permease protein